MDRLTIMFVSWNVLVALFYGLDKLYAKNGSRRIRERTLLLWSFCLGGIGAMFGMVWFNHKTSKKKFRMLVPLAAVLSAGVAIAMYRHVHL